jgi:hypothetical protein
MLTVIKNSIKIKTLLENQEGELIRKNQLSDSNIWLVE